MIVDVHSGFEVELNALWEQFIYTPPPSPTLASNTLLFSPVHSKISEKATAVYDCISCVLCPISDPVLADRSWLPWYGPDPLSSSTSTEEVFLFLSAYFKLSWVEFRLYTISRQSGHMVKSDVFVVCRVESPCQNLAWMRQEIQSTILQYEMEGPIGIFSFQLLIYPCHKELIGLERGIYARPSLLYNVD